MFDVVSGILSILVDSSSLVYSVMCSDVEYQLSISLYIIYKSIPPSSPTCFPYPCLWNLGVGEAGPKNVGEAENLRF